MTGSTEELIAALSADKDRRRRPSPSMLVLGAASLALVLTLAGSFLVLKPRPDLSSFDGTFMLKLAFATSMVVVALTLVRDLSIPGKTIGAWYLVPALPMLVLGLFALHEAGGSSAHTWHQHIAPASWLECAWKIPLLSLPALLVLTFAVRRLAPTHLVRAGAYVGLAAGAIGAEAYLFHGHDDSFVYLALGYTIGVLEVVLLGALLGPWFLRWSGAAPSAARAVAASRVKTPYTKERRPGP